MGSLDTLLNLLLKLLGRGHLALAENLVIGLLVLLGGHIGLHVHHGESEHRVQSGELVLLHLEHGGTVRLVGEGGVHIHLELVPGFLAQEGSAGLFGHMGNGNIHALGLVALVLDIGHNVVLLTGLLAFLQGTVLLEKLLLLGLLLGGGDVNLVVRNLVVLAHLDVQLRSLGDVKLEGEALTGLPGQLGLVFGGHGLSQHTHLVVGDKLVDGVSYQAVHALVKRLVSVHALNQLQGSHALAEAFDIGLAFVLIEALAQRLGIIFRSNLDGQQIVERIRLDVGYIHS